MCIAISMLWHTGTRVPENSYYAYCNIWVASTRVLRVRVRYPGTGTYGHTGMAY